MEVGNRFVFVGETGLEEDWGFSYLLPSLGEETLDWLGVEEGGGIHTLALSFLTTWAGRDPISEMRKKEDRKGRVQPRMCKI